jgi:hypothetical protein
MEALAAAVEPLRFSSHISTLSDATGIGLVTLQSVVMCCFPMVCLCNFFHLYLLM